MWRDIAIIVALILALLTYFQITPRRIYGYIKTTKVEVTKRPIQIIYLALAISFSIFCIVWLIYKYEHLDTQTWSHILFIIVVNDVLWLIILGEFWKLSRNGIFLIVTFLVLFLANIGYSILSYDLLWKRILYSALPLIGWGVGYGFATLRPYIKKKRSSKEKINK